MAVILKISTKHLLLLFSFHWKQRGLPHPHIKPRVLLLGNIGENIGIDNAY